MADERLDTAARIHRLLAILRHAASLGGPVPMDGICDRFGLDRGQLLRELNMATMIGADSPNYDDMPFEVLIGSDDVEVRLFSLDRPLRLTPEEGMALIVAADAIVDGEPDGSPLRRGLGKLASLLEVEPGESIDVDASLDGGPAGRLIQQVIAARGSAAFTYWTYGTDEVAERVIEPWVLFQTEGVWYVAGHDVEKGELRRFRVDRMSEVVVLDRRAETDRIMDGVDRIDLGENPRAELLLPARARWVAESLPIEGLEDRDDGTFRVVLPVAGRSWLARLLLRVGQGAEIVSLDPGLGDHDVVAEAAGRILARYRGDDAATVGSEP